MKGKTCTKCGEWKAFVEFYKNKSMKDGYRSACKTCCLYSRKSNSQKIKISEKHCNACGKIKPIDYFNKDKWTKDGYKTICKKCLIAKKENRENKENKDTGKTCGKCGEWKLFENFYKNVFYKTGYESYCKDCKNEHSKKKYNENIEINRSKRTLTTHKYRQENTEQYKIVDKKYRQRNAERIKEYLKEYGKSEKGREILYRARLKRRSYEQKVFFAPHKRKQILDRDKWTCQSCGIKVHDRSTGNWNTPDKAHVDHVIPVSKGGNSEPSNLQTLCRTCNLSKSDKVELQLALF